MAPGRRALDLVTLARPRYTRSSSDRRLKLVRFACTQGDHLISQCTYNSESRSTITLGGLSTREETCLAYLLYWPRVDLSLCYSLPSLATILHSLGIEELHP